MVRRLMVSLVIAVLATTWFGGTALAKGGNMVSPMCGTGVGEGYTSC